MAGTITLALQTARSGLLTNQAALNAVANNIANVNTEGYSRKVVNLEQRVVAGAGAGVQMAELTRKIDEGLLKSLRLEFTDFTRLEVQENYYQRLQELFGSPGDNNSVSHIISEFADSMESLVVNPDKTLEQSEMVRWGKELVIKLQKMSTTIQELRQQADQAIASIVPEINALITRIGDLNDKIISNSTVGNDVTDLRDMRDEALDSLSKLLDIRYFYRSDGDVVVFTSGGRTLVDNISPTLTHASASSVAPTMTHSVGNFSPIYVGDMIASNDITNELRGGELKGLVELRDDILTSLQSQLDELAAEIRDAVNQVHNRGAPFPGMQSMTGTRIFIEPATQRIRLSGTSDTRLILFDSSGDQAASVSLKTLMTDLNFGGNVAAYDGATGYVANEYWTIDDMASVIQRWLNDNPLAGGGNLSGAGLGLTGNTVSMDSDGKLVISVNSSSYSLAFRDENAIDAPGSTHTDATIQFEADSDGVPDADETVSGFSNFFGFNDFFVDSLLDNIYDSDVMSSTFTVTGATLSFRDATGSLGDLVVSGGDSLQTLATNITANITNVTASLIPDGDGYRLRIAHDSGSSMVVTQVVGTDTLLTTLGLHSADVRMAGSMTVRSDIINSPGNISRGAVQWDSNLGFAGQYFTSAGDSTIISTLAETFATARTFDQAGGIGAVTLNFAGYGGAILSRSASLASTNEANTDYHRMLSQSLEAKSDTIRGVNLDEEMANLILFEQAYSASARVISVIQNMFEALERAVG